MGLSMDELIGSVNGLPGPFNVFCCLLCCLGEVGRFIISNFAYGILKIANELLENKIIRLCGLIGGCFGWEFGQGREFLCGTWAVVGRNWKLVDFHVFCAFLVRKMVVLIIMYMQIKMNKIDAEMAKCDMA